MIRSLTLLITSLAILGIAANAQTKMTLKYAKNFEVEIYETHKIATVKNLFRGSEDTSFTYALVPRATKKLPELPKDAIVIRTPLKRVVTMATSFLGAIQDLEIHDTLVGAAYVELTNDTIVLEQIKSGKTKKVLSGSALDIESMMMLRPDAIFTSSTGNPQFDVHPKLSRSGLPVIITSGYMEEHLLARNEWLKFMAAFVNREDDAERIFNETEARYMALVELAANATDKPTVMSNAPYGGIWHVAGGQSYTAKAFKDAGANYLWSDDSSTGGVPLDFERVYFKAANADFWMQPSAYKSLNALTGSDERFAKFKAFKTGNIYNNTKRTNENGGNDYWERGIRKPDEILADLIAIFHPDLLPDHEFVFYENLK